MSKNHIHIKINKSKEHKKQTNRHAHACACRYAHSIAPHLYATQYRCATHTYLHILTIRSLVHRVNIYLLQCCACVLTSAACNRVRARRRHNCMHIHTNSHEHNSCGDPIPAAVQMVPCLRVDRCLLPCACQKKTRRREWWWRHA